MRAHQSGSLGRVAAGLAECIVEGATSEVRLTANMRVDCVEDKNALFTMIVPPARHEELDGEAPTFVQAAEMCLFAFGLGGQDALDTTESDSLTVRQLVHRDRLEFALVEGFVGGPRDRRADFLVTQWPTQELEAFDGTW